MRHIGQEIDALFSERGPNSERAHIIDLICTEIFTKKDFKKILGQTKEFTILELRGIFDESRSWEKNPAALCWKLIRQKQKEITQKKKDTE